MKFHRTTLQVLAFGFCVTEAQNTAAYQTEILDRELARRQAASSDASRLEQEGDELLGQDEIASALAKYEAAYELLPDAPITAEQRTVLKDKLDGTKSEFAQTLRAEGKLDEAKALVQGVIDDADSNKSNKNKATKVLNMLEDSGQTNPSISPKFIEEQEAVQDLLEKARGYYDLGLNDEAIGAYEQVLFIDPYNKAARKGLSQVSKAKSKYYDRAQSERRAYMLSQVDSEWEREASTRREVVSIEETANVSSGSLSLKKKAQDIVIPNIEFNGETLGEALDDIRRLSKEFDPGQEGVNIVVDNKNRQDANGEDLGSIKDEVIHSLRLTNVKISDLIKVLATQFELYPQYEDFAIRLVDGKTQLFNKTFRVDSGFKDNLNSESGGGGASDDPFADTSSSSLIPRKSIKQLLSDRGVSFGPGESASLFGNRLVIRGTSQTLELVEIIVDNNLRGAPKQVMVKSKFIEVSQNNLEELGFDWSFDTLNFDSGSRVVSGDGLTSTNGVHTATSGLRSGSAAISANGLDGIVDNVFRVADTATPTAGILSIGQTNILGAAGVTALIRGVNQRSGADVLSAPSVVTKSGVEATIDIVREMRFPTEYEPPQIPQTINGGANINLTDDGTDNATAPSIPVTPANPTSFEVKDVGISLTVSPEISDDARTINLELSPEIIEFDGFINYGSPITSGGALLTLNRIEMPVFSTRSVSSSLTIYDGNTVALGGLITEDVQQYEDSVPLLGDIPVLGRLFKSKGETTVKKNLMILVTAEIIDASGFPLRLSESADSVTN